MADEIWRAISSLKSEINSLKGEIGNLRYNIGRNIEYIGDTLVSIQSQINDIYIQLSSLSKRIKDIERDISILNSKVDKLEIDVINLRRELRETRDSLEARIDNVRRELYNEIINTKRALEMRIDDVEKRVDEAREELDNHLTAQDHEINISKEGVLNIATVQTILTVLQTNPKSHAVICQVNEKPVIVVDKGDFVQIVLISEEPDNKAKEIIDNLCTAIRESTGKIVEGYTVSAIRESEKPIWIANIESIVKLSE